MRTSLNETRQIEQYLFKDLDQEEALVFEAKTILSPKLADRVLWQNKTYTLIKQYGRRKLREEIASVQQQLFQAPEHRGFRQKILQLFTRR